MPGVDTKFVKYEVKDRVAWVTLNRPEAMNALSQGLLADLNTVFREVGRDDDALVVILTGEGGRAFSAGMDLKEFAARQAEQAAAGQTPGAIGTGPAFSSCNSCSEAGRHSVKVEPSPGLESTAINP